MGDRRPRPTTDELWSRVGPGGENEPAGGPLAEVKPGRGGGRMGGMGGASENEAAAVGALEKAFAATIEKKDRDMDTWKKLLYKSKVALQKLQESYVELQGHYADGKRGWREQAQKLEARAVGAEGEAEKLRAEVEALKGELRAEKEAGARALERAQGKAEALRRDGREKDASLGQIKEGVAALKLAAAEKTKELEELHARCEAGEDLIAQKDRQIEVLTLSTAQLKAEVEQRIHDLSREIAQLTARGEKAEAKQVELIRELDAANAQKEKLDAKKVRLQAKVREISDGFRGQLWEKNELLRQLQGDMKRLRSNYDNALRTLARDQAEAHRIIKAIEAKQAAAAGLPPRQPPPQAGAEGAGAAGPPAPGP